MAQQNDVRIVAFPTHAQNAASNGRRKCTRSQSPKFPTDPKPKQLPNLPKALLEWIELWDIAIELNCELKKDAGNARIQHL
eukprot:378251-Amphidinium_carterae.2